MCPKISVWKFGNLADSGRFWHAQSRSRLLLLVSQRLRDTAHSCTFLPSQILAMHSNVDSQNKTFLFKSLSLFVKEKEFSRSLKSEA